MTSTNVLFFFGQNLSQSKSFLGTYLRINSEALAKQWTDDSKSIITIKIWVDSTLQLDKRYDKRNTLNVSLFLGIFYLLYSHIVNNFTLYV